MGHPSGIMRSVAVRAAHRELEGDGWLSDRCLALVLFPFALVWVAAALIGGLLGAWNLVFGFKPELRGAVESLAVALVAPAGMIITYMKTRTSDRDRSTRFLLIESWAIILSTPGFVAGLVVFLALQQ